MDLEWQHYVLLGFLALGFVSAIYRAYNERVATYTPMVVLGAVSVSLGLVAVVTTLSMSWGAIILCCLYSLNAILVIAKLGDTSEPLEGPGELTIFAIFNALMLWLILSL